jgi:hypothetical protein
MAAASDSGPRVRIVEGNKLRCPNCGQLGDPFIHFKPLDLKEQFSDELFRVQQHRTDRGGCGHCFAPGEPWIIQAYLAGDLVPRGLLVQAREEVNAAKAQIMDLQEEAASLREQISEIKAHGNSRDEERRVEHA